nr:hypothetical protein [Tanacetum cinerariifolium]
MREINTELFVKRSTHGYKTDCHPGNPYDFKSNQTARIRIGKKDLEALAVINKAIQLGNRSSLSSISFNSYSRSLLFDNSSSSLRLINANVWGVVNHVMASIIHEPSYNQNYNDKYYPHDSPSFLSCDNCGESHETFQYQPMNQNIVSSGFDQFQTPQYHVIHKEVFQAKGNLIKYIQTFLEKFNCIPFEEMPKILSQAWEKFFAIQHAQPEDTNELFQKLLEDLQIINEELTEYINSPSWNHLTFFNDNEEHSVQYKEYLENSSNAIAAMNFNQEKEGPPQDSDIHQLVREECGIEVCEEQKQNMEDTLLELLEVCRQKEFYCMHNNVDDLIESAFNSKLLLINLKFQRLDKKNKDVENVVEQPTKHKTRIAKSLKNFRVKKSSTSLNNTSQISPVHEITPILPTKEPEYSLNMGYEHLSIISKTESDEVIESSAKNFLPIPSEYEVTSDDEIEDSDSQREEIDIFTGTDDLLPLGIESDDYDSERDIHFLEELLVDDSISLLENESSYFDHHDDPSFPRPFPESLDVKFFFDLEPDLIVMNTIDELNEDECFDIGSEIDVFANVKDDDYFPFIFVIRIFLPYLIYPEVSPLLLSAENEDTIFDPVIFV